MRQRAGVNFLAQASAALDRAMPEVPLRCEGGDEFGLVQAEVLPQA
jgi:hypothetical protein